MNSPLELCQAVTVFSADLKATKALKSVSGSTDCIRFNYLTIYTVTYFRKAYVGLHVCESTEKSRIFPLNLSNERD